MQAIRTRWHAPTNLSPTRISATCQAARIIRPQPDAAHHDDAHRLVAEELAAQLGWDQAEYYGRMIGGQLPDGDYVFVFTGREG